MNYHAITSTIEFVVIDNCKSRPCQNGQCVNFPGGFKCRCRPGFTGKRCESGKYNFKSCLRGFYKSLPGPVRCVKLFDSNRSFCGNDLWKPLYLNATTILSQREKQAGPLVVHFWLYFIICLDNSDKWCCSFYKFLIGFEFCMTYSVLKPIITKILCLVRDIVLQILVM